MELVKKKCVKCGCEYEVPLACGWLNLCNGCLVEFGDIEGVRERLSKERPAVMFEWEYGKEGPKAEFYQTGWVCPKCGAVMSPDQKFCLHCTPENWKTEIHC